jgi:hypothetical protein
MLYCWEQSGSQTVVVVIGSVAREKVTAAVSCVLQYQWPASRQGQIKNE